MNIFLKFKISNNFIMLDKRIKNYQISNVTEIGNLVVN